MLLSGIMPCYKNKIMTICYITHKHFYGINIHLKTSYEPAHEIMVLITYATSEGSGEPAQSRQSLRCSHTCSMDIDEGSSQKPDI